MTNSLNLHSYTAQQHLQHTQGGYLVTDDESGYCLGGVGGNFYRLWVFPLYTPSGLTVIQEFPFDHPFHTGFFVGQGPVLVNGREAGYWASPPMRKANEALFKHLGRIGVAPPPQIESLDQGVRFIYHLVWRDEHEEPMLDEIRTIDLYAIEDATICDMTSQKIAAYGTVEYPQTKFGSIGIRVEPRLLPMFGGEVIANGGRRGRAEVALDQPCDYVAYENVLAGQDRFGVMLTILDEPRIVQGPWFIRDYGLAFYNPTRERTITTGEGDSWTISLRTVAYDNALTEERARRWVAHTL